MMPILPSAKIGLDTPQHCARLSGGVSPAARNIILSHRYEGAEARSDTMNSAAGRMPALLAWSRLKICETVGFADFPHRLFRLDTKYEDGTVKRSMLREATGVVLVVEHDVLKRLATAARLRRGGLEVFEAADATEAMTVLERIAVDVLLTDANLVDGEPLAQWVKEHDLPTRVCWLVSEIDPSEGRLHS